MWILAGDKSLDYNYYTKRILLSEVYINHIILVRSQKIEMMFQILLIEEFLM